MLVEAKIGNSDADALVVEFDATYPSVLETFGSAPGLVDILVCPGFR